MLNATLAPTILSAKPVLKDTQDSHVPRVWWGTTPLPQTLPSTAQRARPSASAAISAMMDQSAPCVSSATPLPPAPNVQRATWEQAALPAMWDTTQERGELVMYAQ